MKLKFDLGQVLSIVTVIPSLVKKTQQAFKGAKGVEKHEVVADTAMNLIEILEGVTSSDFVSNEKARTALDAVISAEKALLKAESAAQEARRALEAVVADIRSKKALES